jgi:hypothetical protein
MEVVGERANLPAPFLEEVSLADRPADFRLGATVVIVTVRTTRPRPSVKVPTA